MKPILAVAVLLAASFAGTARAQAAAPANDAFANAAPLTVGTLLLTDNIGATSEAGEPDVAAERGANCAAVASRPDCGSSVWFTFAPATAGTYVIDTCDSPTAFDTQLDVYLGGTPGGLSFVASNDDGAPSAARPCGASSSVSFSALAGTTYRIRLAGLGAGEDTTYLGVYAGSAPAAPATSAAFTPLSSAAEAGHIALGASGGRRTASFSFTTTPQGTAAECSLDGAAFTACSSPASYPVAADPATRHEFRVRATGDPTPTVERFTIDRSAPDTTFLEAPPASPAVVAPVTLVPSADDPLGARGTPFSCTIDEIAQFPCGEGLGYPLTVGATVCSGAHTVTAAAYDHAGNLDPSPAVRTFSTSGNGACTNALPQITAPAVSVGGAGTTANASASVTTAGRHGALTLEIGPAAGVYDDGAVIALPPFSGAETRSVGARVTPGTTYHYRLTIRTRSGTSSTPDATFTVPPTAAGTAVQAVSVGTPVMSGPTALTAPVTVANGNPARSVIVSALVDDQPIVLQGAGIARPADTTTSAVASGPTLVPVQLTDVEPGTTLHLRVTTQDQKPVSAATKYTISPDITFVVPQPAGPGTAPPGGGGTVSTPTVPVTPPRPPVVTVPKAFKLTTSLVSVARFSRRSKSLRVTVKGLPAKAKLSIVVKGKKTLVSLSPKAASKAGSRTLALKLGKGARAALKVKSLKRLSFVVSVTPAGAKKQSVTKRVMLK